MHVTHVWDFACQLVEIPNALFPSVNEWINECWMKEFVFRTLNPARKFQCACYKIICCCWRHCRCRHNFNFAIVSLVLKWNLFRCMRASIQWCFCRDFLSVSTEYITDTISAKLFSSTHNKETSIYIYYTRAAKLNSARDQRHDTQARLLYKWNYNSKWNSYLYRKYKSRIIHENTFCRMQNCLRFRSKCSHIIHTQQK